jgi:hypothetical protein
MQYRFAKAAARSWAQNRLALSETGIKHLKPFGPKPSISPDIAFELAAVARNCSKDGLISVEYRNPMI